MTKKEILFFVFTAFCYHITVAQKTGAKIFEGNISPTTSFTLDSSFKLLKWRNIGPFRGGRANAVAGVTKEPNIFYAGYTGGGVWKNVTPKGLPECLINSIETSPHQKGTAYVSATRYKFNDYGAYTYKTTDYGETWIKINDGVQQDDFIRVIREDKKIKGLLYAGAERGFYISDDGGAKWKKTQLNLPIVPVTDLILYNNDLVAATAGRAFWILDDVSAIQQGILDYKALKIFTPKNTYHFNSGGGIPGLDAGRAIGQNAPDGVIIDYSLPEKADTSTLSLQILNEKGNVIRTYTNKKDSAFKPYSGGPPQATVLPSEKGFNRFAWDMRTATTSPDIAGAYVYGDYRGFKIAPGRYRAVLTYKNNSS